MEDMVYGIFVAARGCFFAGWSLHKVFKRKEDAKAWVKKKNPNACRYDYKLRSIKVH